MSQTNQNTAKADAGQNSVPEKLYFGYFDGLRGLGIEMTLEQALSASHQGSCDDDVFTLSRVTAIREQFNAMKKNAIADGLRDAGAWDDKELADHDQNRLRALWLAACDIKDQTASAFHNQEFFYLAPSEFENADDETWMAEMMAERCDEEMSEDERRAEAKELSGWYYWTCCPGCMPDSDAHGPFTTEDQARHDCFSNYQD